MHAESNALRQRFTPPPVLRSSWQQLVMFELDPDISLMDPRDALRPRMTEEKIILLLPALFFFLSLPDLIRQSRDFPVKPWNDRKE